MADPTLFSMLDAAQLIKHYLGMRHSVGDSAGQHVLLYVYWEPTNPEVSEAFSTHRVELNEFAGLVAGSAVRFVAQSYRDVWASWEEHSAWPDIAGHLGALRARYEVTLTTPAS